MNEIFYGFRLSIRLKGSGKNITASLKMENKNLENVPGRNEKPWELEKRMETHFRHAKSRYPAMNIEPMAYERERLSGKGMTSEDRALRKQWLLDQRLAPHEPPNSVVALETMNLPVNPIKRVFRMPMDATFRALAPVLVSYQINIQFNFVLKIWVFKIPEIRRNPVKRQKVPCYFSYSHLAGRGFIHCR